MKTCWDLLMIVSLAAMCLFGSCAAMGIGPQPDIKSADLGLPPAVFPKIGFNDDVITKTHADKPEVPADVKHEDASAKNNGTKVHAPEETTEKVTVASETKPAIKKDSGIATEVSDMLTDNYNRTVYDETTEDSPLQNDTVTVVGPHVVNNGKTHEEAVNKSTAENKTETAITTASSVSVTEEHQNVTATELDVNATLAGTTEDTATQNSSETVTQNITDTTTDSSTLATTVADKENNDKKVKTKDDNRTDKEESTAKPLSTSEESTTKAKEATPEPEATTNLNISENIIEHKADMPMALAASQEHADHDHASNGKSSAFLQPTESAAILAGVFVAIALVGYVGLLVWRRILEKRYGNREMLVNEDDFYDTNDLRNFEL